MLDPLHVGAALLGPQVKPGSERRDASPTTACCARWKTASASPDHLAHAARAHAITGIWR